MQYMLLRELVVNDLAENIPDSGADPGFDQGGTPDRDHPKTAILGPQFCRILVLGPHFWWSGGPPWIHP